MDRLGGTKVDTFGFVFSVPFRPNYVNSDSYGNASTIVLKGPESQMFVGEIDNLAVINNYWDDNSGLELSKHVFGDTFSFSGLAYYGLFTRPGDMECTSDSRYEDAKKIAAINTKGSLRIRSPNIHAAYDVSGNGWQGFAICYAQEEYAVIQLDLIKGKKIIDGSLKVLGKCNDLRDLNSEPKTETG